MNARFDAVVVGSGFGGSVCAARLAERGMRVLLLERGPYWGAAHRDRPAADRRDLPRGLLGIRKLLRNVRKAVGGKRSEKLYHADGLLEVHLFDHLNALTASGVGGGSQIYTSILDQPPADFFDAYPPEVTAEELQPHFDRVRGVLRPKPVPALPEKDRVFERAVTEAGFERPERAELAIVWGSDPTRQERVTNAVGVEQRTSTHHGDAFVGCEDGSKTTIDVTYVPLALRHGVEVRPLCEATAIGRAKRGYEVRYHDHRSGTDAVEEAPRLVLAAGCLNTLRLLFAARDRHHALPELPATLGRGFSPNGDLTALVWRARALADSSDGTSFNTFTRVRGPDGRYRFLIGEVGLPVHALPVPWPLRGWLRHSTQLFTMGRDASGGTVVFDGDGLRTTAGRSVDPDLFEEMEDTMRRVAKHYSPRRVSIDAKPLTVHPMGGCRMARSRDEGVTDHRGQVFGHPGLFVADGSLYPRSPGIAPSLTIAALAERQAQLID